MASPTLQSKTALLVSGLSSLLDLEIDTGAELSVNTRSLNFTELGSLVKTILAAIEVLI